ncbi:hypothetical protein [Shigella phage ESh22]|nr:hypothetical protein [Shigella phage ESh21]URY12774.1 hypothetical protein [Shigella phage ESh22]
MPKIFLKICLTLKNQSYSICINGKQSQQS